MRRIITIFCAVLLTFSLNAQIYGPESINMPGTWDSFSNPPAIDALRNPNQSASGDITLITAGTQRYHTTIHCATSGGDVTPGTYDWLFTSGATGNYFGNKWANVTVSMNTIQSYTHQGGTDNSITVTDGKWYTVNFEDIGYTNTNAIFMETSAQPVTLTKVDQTPTSNITPADSVFIGLKLSSTPSVEEKFYVRYSTDGFATSNLTEVTISADSGFTWIPAQSNGISVNYYVFSTTVTNPNGDIDMQTINLINNGGSNYNYTSFQAPKLFITEIADPDNDLNARFVEIFNNEDTAIDLSKGWKIGRYTNNNTSPSTPLNLTGTIPSKGFYVVANDATNFSIVYGISADQNGGTGGPADSNGDDQIYLESPSGIVTDFFGRIGEDGSGTDHEFEDGRAERDSAVTMPSDTFLASEWNIWNDSGGNGTTNSPQNAPADFDPGLWIGYAAPVNPEPTNHATGFMVDSNSIFQTSISWIDADTGTQYPEGYLLIGKTSTGTFATVADNSPVSDDSDFSDGNFSLNLNHIADTQSYNLGQLIQGETYDFEIYPYTNSGADIDFKTASVPSLSFTVPSVNFDTLFFDGFSDCINTQFTTFDSIGATDVWTCGSGYFEMNGFGDEDDEDWLISPLISLSGLDSSLLSFETNERFDGPDLELYFSSNYSGSGAPNQADWKKIAVPFNDASSSSAFSGWLNYGFLDVDSLSGTDGYFAFRYYGTSGLAETWQVDNFLVGGKLISDVIAPSPTNILVVSNTQLKVSFDEPITSATATNTANYTGVANLTSAILNSSSDTVTLNFSSPISGVDTLIIANIADAANNVMPVPVSLPFSTLTIPLFQGFENSLADDLPLTISLAFDTTTNNGATQTPSNQRIKTGATSLSLSNGSGAFETPLVNVGGVSGAYIQMFISATSGTSGNGVDGTDEFKVFVSLNGAAYATTPNIQLFGNSNARWGYSNDGVTIMANRDTVLTAAAGTNNPPIYSNLLINIPSGTSTVQFKVEANNNSTSEFWNVDDILIGSSNSDITPPTIINSYVTSSTQINVVFDEAVDTSATSTSRYTGVSGLTSITLSNSQDTAFLTFTSIPVGAPNTLTINGVRDLAGNPLASPYNFPFFYNGTNTGLVISEIMYNSASTDTLEFVEILNNTSGIINLGGLYFEDAFDFTFPTYNLPSGEYAVIALDTAALKNVFTVSHLFQMDNPSSTGNLTNSSDNIVLRNTLNQVIDSVTYDDGSPWDSRADGNGFSLALCDVNANNTEALNWSISTDYVDGITYASPGMANTCPTPISINIASNTLTPCASDSVMLSANATGGTTTLKYNWGPNGIFNDDTLASPMAQITDTMEVTVWVYDDFSSIRDTLLITPNLVYTTNLFDTICNGDSVLLSSGKYASASGVYLDTLTSSLSCDSFVVNNVFISPNPTISGFSASTPTLDGTFDGLSVWGSPIAMGDGNVGWSNAEAKNLYATRDNNYLYLGAEIFAESWQECGFAINSQTGGDSSEVWGRSIKYSNDSLPDHVVKVTFGNYAERRSWDGSAWVQNVLPAADFAEDENAFVEVRIALSDLGNPNNIGVQFYITGNTADHATFDALPTDQVTNAWSGVVTRLSNYNSVSTSGNFVSDLCEDAGALTFSASPMGGVWSGNGFTNTSSGDYYPTGLGGMLDTLTYTFTSQFGCVGTASDTINIFNLPSVNIGGDVSVCDADLPYQLVAQGGSTYLWNDGSTNDTLGFNATSDSLMIVTVTNNGCSSIDSAFIIVNTSPAVALGNDTSICDGETLEFQINSNGNTVAWSNTSSADSIFVSPSTNTTYWVELTSTDNCVASDTLNVSVNALPTLSLSNDTSVCEGTTLNLTATSNGTVSWSNGSNVAGSGNLTITSDSTFYVVATSAQNCNVNDSIFITSNITPSVSIVGLDTVIYGTFDTMNVVVSPIGAYTYNWSPGSALLDSTLSQVVTNNLNAVTPFSVEVTDIVTGCSGSDNYTAFISGGPLQINPTAAAICFGDTSSLIANVSGGTGNYSFVWNPSSGLSDTTISNPTTSPSITTKYYLTVDDGFNMVTDSVTVTVNPNPTLSISGINPSFCGASNGIAIAAANNGTSPYSYSWTNFGSNDSIMNLVEGTYYVSVLDANNCSANDSVTLSNPSINTPMVSTTNGLTFCKGDSTMLFVNNQLGVGSYQWMNDSGLIAGATDTSIWVNGVGNYFVMLSSNCGNVNSDTVTVGVSPNIMVNIYDTICAVDTSFFNGLGYTSSGMYSDTSLSTSGCDSITQFNLVVNSLPSISFGTSSTPTIDGVLDATGAWNNPIASADGIAGWAGANASNLYLAEDANNYYLGASAQTQSWQAWAFLINTTSGGGTIDSWSRDINYGHADAPDFIFRGNYDATANYAEFHNWNGVSWAGIGNQASPTTYGIGNDFVEVAISKASLGNPSSINVQFFVTGDQNSHGTFDAIPDDEVDTSWSGPTTTLANYATPNYNSLSLTFCGNDPITAIPVSPSGGMWMGNGIVNATTGDFNPSLVSGNDTLTYSFTNTNGCSNMGYVYVTSNPTSVGFDTTEICASDSVFLAGAWQNTAGNYVDSLQNSFGCDSIVTTTLNILPSKSDSVDSYICAGDSIFIGGAFRSTPGIYTDNFTTFQFCDSVVTINLMIAPLVNTNLNTSICLGDSLFAGGAWQTSSGSYTDTLFSAFGCDSIVTTNLTVSNTISSNVSTNICLGDSLFVGGSYQYNSGTYFDTTSTASGCDSVTITQLMVMQPTVDSVMATICSGDSILLEGSFQNTQGWYVDSLSSASGCDSVVYTELMIQMAFNDTLNTSICAGDSILLGGSFQNTAGTYQDNFQTIFGCDSIVTTNLTVLPTSLTQDTATICAGDSIMLSGAFQTIGGLFTDVYSASNGCDSTIETFLIVNPIPVVNAVTVSQISTCGATDGSINISATAGAGNLMYSIDAGNTFSTSGIFNNLSSAGYTVVVEDGGCSVTDTSITLTAPGQTAAPLVSNDTTYCVGNTVSALTATGANIKWYSAPTLTAADSIGVGNSYSPTLMQGTNTVYATQTVGSCESPSAVITITLNANPIVNAGADNMACSGVDFTLSAIGASSYQWNVTASGNNITLNIDSLGTYPYYVVGTDVNGCSASDTTMVMVNGNPSVTVGNIAAACVGDSAQTLNVGLPFGGVYSGNNISMDSVFMPMFVGLDTIVYTYTDGNGCSGTDTISVLVNGQPAVSIGSIANLCANDLPIALSQGLPIGGVYAGTAVDSLGNFDPSLAMVGTNMVTYTYTDSIGCSNAASTMITIDSLPNVSFGSVPRVCAQSIPFPLSSGLPFGGVYSGFGVALDSIFNPSTAGQNVLTYTFTDGNGCSNSDTSLAVVDSLPKVDLGNVNGLCQGGNLILSAPTGFASYLWSNNSTATQILISSLGTYGVTVTDANGCEGSDQVTLNQTFNLPNVSITPDDTTICAGDFVELKAGNWSSYEWSNSSTQPTIKVSTDGIYRVTVTNNNGCENTASTTVSLTTDPALCGSIGVVEITNNRMVSVYPNPAERIVNLDLVNYKGTIHLQLVDLKGGVYINKTLDISGNQTLELSLDDIASGVYFIKVGDAIGIENIKLVIQ